MVSGCNMFSNGHCILSGLRMGASFLSVTDKTSVFYRKLEGFYLVQLYHKSNKLLLVLGPKAVYYWNALV